MHASDCEGVKPKNFVAISVITTVAFLFLSMSFLGQHVHVLGDEFTYSYDAQHNDFSQSTYPVWLYLVIFRAMNMFGDGFYHAARTVNALIFALSAPFIYATARQYVADRWALLIATVSVFSPISVYVAFFMPDAVYFTCFWVVTWFVLTMPKLPRTVYGFGIGLLSGSATLVKPHGMFVLVAILLALGALALTERHARSLSRFLQLAATVILGFIIIRFGLGFLLAGMRSFDITGAYSQWTGDTEWTAAKTMESVRLGWILLSVHVSSIAVWLGPCAIAITCLLRSDTTIALKRLAFYLIATGIILFAISIIFSIRIADGAPTVDGYRVHMRYYNLIFPLLLIALATSIEHLRRPNKLGLMVGTFVLAGCVAGAFSYLTAFPFIYIDAPEIRGLIAAGEPWLQIIAAASGVASILMMLGKKQVVAVYLAVLFPTAALGATLAVQQDLRHRLLPVPTDSAAAITAQMLARDNTPLMVVGEAWHVLNARFRINIPGNDDICLTQGPPGACISMKRAPVATDVPARTEWVLFLNGAGMALPKFSTVVEDPQGDWKLLRRVQAAPTP